MIAMLHTVEVVGFLARCLLMFTFLVDSDVDESKDVKPGVDYSGLDDVVRPEFDQLDYDEDVDEGEIKSEEVSNLIYGMQREIQPVIKV